MAKHPIVAPTIVRFSMQADINSRACDNIVDVSLDETGVSREDAVNTLVPLVVGVWQENIIPAVGSWYRFHGAQWVDIDSLTGASGFEGPQSGKPILGGAGGSQHTPNTSVLIKKGSASSHRNQRNGRMYLAPILETDTDDGGTLSGGATTRFQNAVNGLKSDIGDLSAVLETVAWRVVHIVGHDGDEEPGYPNGRPNEWDSTTIETLVVDPKAATQRRRLR